MDLCAECQMLYVCQNATNWISFLDWTLYAVQHLACRAFTVYNSHRWMVNEWQQGFISSTQRSNGLRFVNKYFKIYLNINAIRGNGNGKLKRKAKQAIWNPYSGRTGVKSF